MRAGLIRRLRHSVVALAAAAALGASAPAQADPITIVTVAAYAAGGAGLIAAATATYIALGASIVGGVMARRKAKRAAARNRDAQAASLQDRCVTLMTAEPEPRVIYGRCSVGGWVIDKVTSSKTYMDDAGRVKTKPDAYQHIVIGIACHEVEAIHDVFMYGEWLNLAGAQGWVNGGPADAPYGKPHNVAGQSTVTFSNGAATLPAAQIGYTISRIISISRQTGDSEDVWAGTPTVSGANTIAGGPASGIWVVNYEVSKINSSVRVEFFSGRSDQTASAWLRSVAPAYWTEAHRLRGIAGAIITFDLDDSRHQGIPGDLAFDVSGRKVLDPRTGVTAWSRNAALCTYDWMLQRWGLALAQDDVRDIQALANLCDQQIQLQVGSTTTTGPRYTIDGSFGVNADKSGTLADMTEAMGGFAAQGAAWSLHAGAWTAPVMPITEDDLAAPIRVVRSASALEERFNAARATYLPERSTQPADADPYVNATFVAADGRREWSDFTFPFTNHKARARNLLRQFVEQVRAGLVIQVVGKMQLWPLEVGDRVTVTYARLGLVADTFRVIDWTWSPGAWVTLTLQRDIEASYDDADASTPDPAPATRLPNPGLVDTPAGITAASGNAHLQKLGDGTIIPRVLVSWNAPSSIYMSDPSARTAVRWRRAMDAVWSEVVVSGDTTSAYLTGMADKTLILISVQHRNSFGAVSPWNSLAHAVVGKSGAPTAPSALTVTETPTGERFFKFTHVQDLDHAGYIIRASQTLTATFSAMTQQVAEWAGDSLTGRSGSPAAGTWRLGAVAFDSSGNLSAPVYVTANLTADVAAAAAAATAAASAAQSSANAALGQIQAISSDGQLSPVEKKQALIDWAELSGGRLGLEAQATAYGITLERDSYTAAVVALSDYLSGLSPSWSDTTSSTPIVPAVYRSTWNTALQARQALLVKIAQVAGTLATWGGTTGRPANLAGLSGGEKIRNDQLSQGANILFDSDFTIGSDASAWVITHRGAANIQQYGVNLASGEHMWVLNRGVGPSTNTLYLNQLGRTAGGDSDYIEVASAPIPVETGKRYCVSAYTGAHRCMVSVFPYYYNEGGIVAHGYNSAATVENNEEKNGDGTQGFASWKRCFSISEAPAGAKYLRLMLRKNCTKAGHEDSWMFAARGQVEEVGAAADQPGPWTVGPSGARFGENIFGQAGMDDLAPNSATEVIFKIEPAPPIFQNMTINAYDLARLSYIVRRDEMRVIIRVSFPYILQEPSDPVLRSRYLFPAVIIFTGLGLYALDVSAVLEPGANSFEFTTPAIVSFARGTTAHAAAQLSLGSGVTLEIKGNILFSMEMIKA